MNAAGASFAWPHLLLLLPRSSPNLFLTPCQCGSSPRRLNNLAPLASKPTEQNIMKRALMTITTLAVLGASAPRVEAGDKEWATAGKVMAGVGAGLLLAKALEPEPVYSYSPPPVYVQPAPVTQVGDQPAPVVVQPSMAHVTMQPQQSFTPNPSNTSSCNTPSYITRPPSFTIRLP